MQRAQVLLVDAFADEPTGGRTVAVDPTGELSESQRRAVAGELGTSGVVTVEDETVRYTDCDGSHAVVSAAVAGAAGLYDRGAIEPGSYELRTDGPGDGPFPVELDERGAVTVELPSLTPERAPVGFEAVAAALGIDDAAMRDVGADLPLAAVEAFGGTLLVPVNFLQHLSGASPAVGGLAELLEEAGASRAFVFTFDTLDAAADVHARVFDPSAAGNERAASGVGAAACGAHLFAEGVFDGDREEAVVECGQFADRPGRITTTLGPAPRTGGSALTTLDAELLVPDAEDEDGIIEV
ncbi:MAG: PhzF family phenazine biosynthesis protein [Haloferacaceae archaeon]